MPRPIGYNFNALLNSGAPSLDNFTDSITVEIGHSYLYKLSDANDPDNDTINCTFILSSATPFTEVKDKKSLLIKPKEKTLIGTTYTLRAVLTDDNIYGSKT